MVNDLEPENHKFSFSMDKIDPRFRKFPRSSSFSLPGLLTSKNSIATGTGHLLGEKRGEAAEILNHQMGMHIFPKLGCLSPFDS